MDKDKFNRYCADVIGYETCANDGIPFLRKNGILKMSEGYYNPYNDLNQMAEVFDKLDPSFNLTLNECGNFIMQCNEFGIKQAMRDFIISTMPEDKSDKT